MKCISPTHELSFNGDYRVWSFIHCLWGLEIRILRERGQNNEAQSLAQTIEEHYLTPTKHLQTPEEINTFEMKRRSRFTYEDAIQQTKIEDALQDNNVKSANEWRFIALLGMIGNTETGLYPNLNDAKGKIAHDINNYIKILSQLN